MQCLHITKSKHKLSKWLALPRCFSPCGLCLFQDSGGAGKLHPAADACSRPLQNTSLRCMQAKSVASEQLLNADGSGSRWVALASLADSLSFLAEDLASHIARARPHEGEPQNPPGSLGSPTRLLQTQRSFLMKGDADGLLRGLSHLMDQ